MKTLLKPYNLLRLAALGALVALVLMVGGFLLPGPIPLILFMSAGQGLGTLSLAIYIAVIVGDLRRKGVLRAKEGTSEPGGVTSREGEGGEEA